MIKFSTIGQIEKKYAFEDAVANANTFNGAFGSVSEGKFTAGANGVKAIMQLEVGDNAGLDTYPIAKDEHVRVVDLTKFDGETIEVYGDEVPASVVVGNKLASDSTGKLVTGASAAPYFEVTKVIGGTHGVEVTVVATEPEGATGATGEAEGATGATGGTE